MAGGGCCSVNLTGGIDSMSIVWTQVIIVTSRIGGITDERRGL